MIVSKVNYYWCVRNRTAITHLPWILWTKRQSTSVKDTRRWVNKHVSNFALDDEQLTANIAMSNKMPLEIWFALTFVIYLFWVIGRICWNMHLTNIIHFACNWAPFVFRKFIFFLFLEENGLQLLNFLQIRGIQQFLQIREIQQFLQIRKIQQLQLHRGIH